MDYVVFGTGYGATLMLLGWALRTFGPHLRYQDDPDTAQGADKMMARLSWRRFASSLGAVIVTSGVSLILITFIIILINPGDRVGSRIAWACLGLILLAVAVWMWLYVGRFGIYGILPERQEPATVFRSPAPARESVEPAGDAVPVLVSPHEPVEDIPVEELVDDEAEGYEPWIEEEFAGEQEARYAKYQVHHPGESDETAPYEEALPSDEEEPVDVAGNVSELAAADLEPGDAGEEAADEDTDEVGELTPGDESVVISEEPVEVLEEAPEPIPAEHAVAEPLAEDEQDASKAGTDADSPDPGEESDAASDASPILSDTPEGRAEALRRIEAWQPEEPDTEEKS